MLSCNQESSKTAVNQNNPTDSTVSGTKNIFGKWTMCSTYAEGMVTQFNVCPAVRFNNNGTGNLELNGGIAESFTWTLKTPGLKIFYNNPNPNLTFPDTFYYAGFNKTEEGIKLTLTHNDRSYYLSR